ncbi:hypothetical protein ACGFZB_28620 [Streptomyces cinerochromogenes]|uniref:Deoxynucleoside monophosphate kinase n=1 Tax=Streptomyces cinerochromogenes TaxID=66422 RepID=A0ABW7BAT5_9ACTN
MNIGIIGRARSGKDTAGAWFVNERGYRRVALADPLKEAALRLDPIINFVNMGAIAMAPATFLPDRLSELVACDGWERTKDEYPEVRRILQELGAAIRAIDEDFWLRQALKSTQQANDAGTPVVITDVRYRNEATSLARAGFHLLHIDRPGVQHLDHESEGALGPEDARYLVRNDGTYDDLYAQLDLIWDEIHALESVRFACKF